MPNAPRGVAAAIKEYLVPELEAMRAEFRIVAGQQEEMSKRVDDLVAQVAIIHGKLDRQDQRFERLEERMDDRFARVDERFSKIDERFSKIDERFSEISESSAQMEHRLMTKIEDVRADLGTRIDRNTLRIDQTNVRIDRLFELSVRRDEHVALERRVSSIEEQTGGRRGPG